MADPISNDNKYVIGSIIYGKKTIETQYQLYGRICGYVDKDFVKKSVKKQRIFFCEILIILIAIIFMMGIYRMLSDNNMFFTGQYDFFVFIAFLFIGVFLIGIITVVKDINNQTFADETIKKYILKEMTSQGFDAFFTPHSFSHVFGKKRTFDELPVEFIKEKITTNSLPEIKNNNKKDIVILSALIILTIVFILIAYMYMQNPIIVEEHPEQGYNIVFTPWFIFGFIIIIILIIASLYEVWMRKKHKK